MRWLINIAWLEDRFVLILFTIIRFGIYKSKKVHITELNLFVGFWKFDIKISLGKLKDVRIKTYGEVGRA